MADKQTFEESILAYYKKDHDFYKGYEDVLKESFKRHEGLAKEILGDAKEKTYNGINIQAPTLTELTAGLFAELEANTLHSQRYAQLIQRQYGDKDLAITDKRGLVEFVAKVAKEKFGWSGVPDDQLYRTVMEVLGSNTEVDGLLKVLGQYGEDPLKYSSAVDQLIVAASNLKSGETAQGILSRYSELRDARGITAHEYGAAVAAHTHKVSKGQTLEDAVNVADLQQAARAAASANAPYIREKLGQESWKSGYNP